MPSPPDMTQAEALKSVRGKTSTTVPIAAVLCDMSLSAMYEAINRGEIPGVFRIGRRIVVPVAPLLDMLGLTAERQPLDAA